MPHGYSDRINHAFAFAAKHHDQQVRKVLEDVLSVTERKRDEDDVELDWEERKTDYLERIGGASERARWVCAADKIHNGSSLLADLRRTAFPESVWGRFKRGPEETVRWYRRVHDRLVAVGFAAPIMDELREVVVALEALAASEADTR